MTNEEQKLREIAKTYGGCIITGYGQPSGSGSQLVFTAEEQLFSDLTSLIEEHYYPKEKYDELLQQRDELKEALQILMDGVRGLPPLTAIVGVLEQQYKQAEAAIKNTETK